MQKPEIIHIITGLKQGGAEAFLFRLISNDKKFDHLVICLTNAGTYSEKLKALGVKVIHIDLQIKWSLFANLNKFYRLLKSRPNSLIQTWMYHADLIGGLMATLARHKHVFWNVRGIITGPQKTKTYSLIAFLCGILSRFIPRHVIFNSKAAMKNCETEWKYNPKINVLISNGFDEVMQTSINKVEAKDSKAPFNIGMIARYDPNKDHATLLHALKILNETFEDYVCHFIGEGMNENNSKLINLANSLNVEKNIKFHGAQDNVNCWIKTFDITVLTSVSESFPNVIGESMMLGVPCVSTDCGDARYLVGECGWLVPIKRPKEIAEAILAAYNESRLSQKWQNRKKLCIKHINDNYHISIAIEQYQSLWLKYVSLDD